MSKKGGDNDYKKRRKAKEKEQTFKTENRKEILTGRGPVGLVIAKIVDVMISTVKKVIYWICYGLVEPLFMNIYNALFSEFKGIFGGKEKDGECYSTIYLRYIITILVPPVGIFLSKGLNGWPSIIISCILCFYHMFPGIIYSLVVTYSNRYADRYEFKEREQLEEQKKRREIEGTKYSLISLVISICIFVGIIYLLLFMAKKIGNYRNK